MRNTNIDTQWRINLHKSRKGIQLLSTRLYVYIYVEVYHCSWTFYQPALLPNLPECHSRALCYASIPIWNSLNWIEVLSTTGPYRAHTEDKYFCWTNNVVNVIKVINEKSSHSARQKSNLQMLFQRSLFTSVHWDRHRFLLHPHLPVWHKLFQLPRVIIEHQSWIVKLDFLLPLDQQCLSPE